MAKTSPPPPNRDVAPLHLRIPQSAILHRIYDPDSFGATPTGFRFRGPYARFDHHTADSNDRGIIYASVSFKACLAEVYGDRGYGSAHNRKHCGISLSRSLLLLDLRGDGALRAGTIAQISAGPHHIARRWSRHFYANPPIYGTIDGIAYRNAHNEQTTFALYERSADALAVEWDNRLDDPSRRAEYHDAAREANLLIAFYM